MWIQTKSCKNHEHQLHQQAELLHDAPSATFTFTSHSEGVADNSECKVFHPKIDT